MGTQQLLFIVLGIIIVGMGIANDNQRTLNTFIRDNRMACITDMNNFASQALLWQKAPSTLGGNNDGTVYASDISEIVDWIGNSNETNDGFKTENGTFRISVFYDEIMFFSTANEGTYSKLTFNVDDGTITTIPTYREI